MSGVDARKRAAGVMVLGVVATCVAAWFVVPAPDERLTERTEARHGLRSPASRGLVQHPSADDAETDELDDEQLRCDVELEDGELTFRRLEAFAPSVRSVVVESGTLRAKTDDPSGEGDLYRAETLVGRLAWETDADGARTCSVASAPLSRIVGEVSDEGGPVGGARITGCGEVALSGADGAWALEVPEGRTCRVRAVVEGAELRVSPVFEVEAPGEALLALGSSLDDEAIDRELQNVARALRAVAPLHPPEDEIHQRLLALDEALAAGDPEELRALWMDGP